MFTTYSELPTRPNLLLLAEATTPLVLGLVLRLSGVAALVLGLILCPLGLMPLVPATASFISTWMLTSVSPSTSKTSTPVESELELGTCISFSELKRGISSLVGITQLDGLNCKEKNALLDLFTI